MCVRIKWTLQLSLVQNDNLSLDSGFTMGLSIMCLSLYYVENSKRVNNRVISDTGIIFLWFPVIENLKLKIVAIVIENSYNNEPLLYTCIAYNMLYKHITSKDSVGSGLKKIQTGCC